MKQRLLLIFSLLFSILYIGSSAEASIPRLSYGVDVSDVSEQRSLTSYAQQGAKFAIIRTSAFGPWLPNGYYGSDNAFSQIQSAKDNNLYVMAYHRAMFGDSTEQAIFEADFAISYAQYYGLERGGYLACDYEVNAGNSKANNTTALLTFMRKVKQAGYQPLVYLGIDYARDKVDMERIHREFKQWVWLANYPKLGAVATPNMEALERLDVDEVLMYQFTNNWCGLDVDGNVLNVTLIPFHHDKKYVTLTRDVSVYKTKTFSKVAGHLYKHHTFLSKGYYIFNGVKYNTLYTNDNQWLGYVKASELKESNSIGGAYCPNQETYMTVKNCDYRLLQELNHKTTRRSLVDNKESFFTKGHYHDFEKGYTYYSLYRMIDGKSVWQGYMNQHNLTQHTDDFGAFHRLPSTRYFTIKKQGYGLFKDKQFKKKTSRSDTLINKRYRIAGYYDRIMGGGRYYSLYDNDTWIGYMKSTAGTVSS